MFKRLIYVLLLFVLTTNRASGWIYPEHRYIMMVAIENLSRQHREALDKLWGEARGPYASRLTDSVIVKQQGVKPDRLDYASWAAIAGDHSCSPDNMLTNVLKTDWILDVADVAARLKIEILKSEKSRNRSQHINAIHVSDIRLQRADIEYATRAGFNNVHFLLARPEVGTDEMEYMRECLSEGAPLNALGAYAWFHISAMHKAARYAQGDLSGEDRAALILAALADEAFAIHFLEDVYAAGHTAGTWGEASMRKGTHDYYNEKGLEIVTWDGKRVILLGDAFMRSEDEELAANNVRLSLEQLIRAANGELLLDHERDIVALVNRPDTFNICKNNWMSVRVKNSDTQTGKMEWEEFLGPVMIQTPTPGLAVGLGAIPRFRSEIGKFLGISSCLNGESLLNGFGKEQTTGGLVGGLEANLRFGVGLDGVLNQAGDGLAFVQGGFRLDASSSNRYDDSSPSIAGIIPAAIPGRAAFNLRLRLPFWLIPGDLLVAGPILFFASRKTFEKMAVTSVNGGAIPWQSGIITPVGRFQFVAGREIGVSFYATGENEMQIPSSTAGTTLVSYSSTKLDFPILEYVPFRTFSMDQTSSGKIQFYAGIDFPHNAAVILPTGAPLPELQPIWHLGMRLIFDWRHYF